MSALAKSILDNLAEGTERKVETIIADDCLALADGGLIRVVMESLLRKCMEIFLAERPRASGQADDAIRICPRVFHGWIGADSHRRQ